MPSKHTFAIKPIQELLIEEVTSGIWLNPFSGLTNVKEFVSEEVQIISNDLNPEFDSDFHLDALDFLNRFDKDSIDGVLFDPVYSPRQLSECYKSVGLSVTKETTQSSFWSNLKDSISSLIKLGGKVITCGWNSNGIGKTRGFALRRLLIVPHGGNHNDTLVTVEIKIN